MEVRICMLPSTDGPVNFTLDDVNFFEKKKSVQTKIRFYPFNARAHQ